VPRTSKIFPPDRYKEHIEILEKWQQGAKHVFMKYRRTNERKHGAYSIARSQEIEKGLRCQ
jgi:hypothetical protein